MTIHQHETPRSCGCCHEQKHTHEHEHHEHHCGCGHKEQHNHEFQAPEFGCSCGCGHDHGHEHSSNGSILRIGAAAALLIIAALLPVDGWLQFIAFLVPYAVIGWDVLRRASRNIARGQVFDENFLMTVATVGAFATGEYPEAVFVMLFYQVGEFFQDRAVDKSRRNIAALMDIRPDWANVERNGTPEQIDPAEVSVGDIMVVKPGERIPLDGVVIEGTSTLNTAALTGESAPRDVCAGDAVVSGCVNQSGLLRIAVTKPYGQSTVARILELVETASARKARAEQFITRFARYYTPAVVGCALLLAVVPPLFVGGWGAWLNRALVFLVVSCPCALVISVPMSFFGGIGGASRAGILVKGGNYLEVLAKAETVVFDKTGTLTEGSFAVTALHPKTCTDAEVLETAALAECWSDHPISRSIRAARDGGIDPARVTDAAELPGRGVQATVDGTPVLAGNEKLMSEHGLTPSPAAEVGTVVHVAKGGVYLGYLVISDSVKQGASQAIAALKACGVKRTVMLTGDTGQVGAAVAAQLGLDDVRARLLPDQKVEQVEQLMGELSPKGTLVYVGDGINDAPVLSRADVGIAMGALGSDAAIEAADVVLMDDNPAKVAQAISMARRTLTIVRQNIVFALGVKAIVLILGAAGIASMWLAVFADVGVAVLAILNAMRALNVKNV